MSWQANDVGVHFNIKETYVLETCSRYEGGDLGEEEELRRAVYKPIKYLKEVYEYLICRRQEWVLRG